MGYVVVVVSLVFLEVKFIFGIVFVVVVFGFCEECPLDAPSAS